MRTDKGMNQNDRTKITEYLQTVYGVMLTHDDFKAMDCPQEDLNLTANEDIITACATAFDISEKMMLSKLSNRPCVYARVAATFFMRKMNDYKQREIAIALKRTRSTVAHNIEQFKIVINYKDFKGSLLYAAHLLNISEEELNKYLTESK
jgi:hypothetical protein